MERRPMSKDEATRLMQLAALIRFKQTQQASRHTLQCEPSVTLNFQCDEIQGGTPGTGAN
ncbi:hypothetical protein EYF80_008945 [Liparis tanakae]|uniref:Uncharacterized protein n=1 Tax=Liparis tanakae TaxID=230148 RepID=A0A4Z2ISG8_9TELE|nr:hypothetical protein EYF80_008945 [Liparis tanakae]